MTQIASATVLQHVLQWLGDKQTAFVFDLDSTLFCVSSRTQAILHSLAGEVLFRQRYPHEAQVLSQIEIQPTDWGIRSALIRHKLASTLDFFETVREYWVKHFFSSQYLHHDLVYPFANEFVQHVGQSHSVYYLSSREHRRMHEGTVRSLKQWGFPLPTAERLLLKMDDHLTDADFKQQQLVALSGRYRRLVYFENEPVIIRQVEGQIPGLYIVFVDTVHSGKAAAPTHLPKIGGHYRWR